MQRSAATLQSSGVQESPPSPMMDYRRLVMTGNRRGSVAREEHLLLTHHPQYSLTNIAGFRIIPRVFSSV